MAVRRLSHSTAPVEALEVCAIDFKNQNQNKLRSASSSALFASRGWSRQHRHNRWTEPVHIKLVPGRGRNNRDTPFRPDYFFLVLRAIEVPDFET